MVTYHYVKFYVSIIIHLEVININVRNPLLDTSLFYLLSETREEASCSHSQGSEINSQTVI